jgi:hypothetical protein
MDTNKTNAVVMSIVLAAWYVMGAILIMSPFIGG